LKHFNKYFINFCAIIFCSLLLVKCVDKKKRTSVNDTPTSGTIHISVDETFEPVIAEQIKVYEALNPGAKIIAHYKSEADCLKDFFNDTANRMVIVTRGLTSKESRFMNDSLSFTPNSDEIATDAIAIVVNANSPDTVFSLAQLQKLLTGKLGNKTSVVFDGLNATSTVRFVMDSILKGQPFDTNIVRAAKNSSGVLNYVANNPQSIGFVGFGWIGNPEDAAQVEMLKKVKISYVKCDVCTDTPFVKPTQRGILSRRYALVRHLYYILKENWNGLGSGFINFLKYEKGQLIFRRAYLGSRMNFDVRSVLIKEKL
jgi:phosphate transport system substrate-binding protein